MIVGNNRPGMVVGDYDQAADALALVDRFLEQLG
jgi:hypothetical protein